MFIFTRLSAPLGILLYNLINQSGIKESSVAKRLAKWRIWPHFSCTLAGYQSSDGVGRKARIQGR